VLSYYGESLTIVPLTSCARERERERERKRRGRKIVVFIEEAKKSSMEVVWMFL
jgi:hypothetical protein